MTERWEEDVVRITDDMKAHITAYVSGGIAKDGSTDIGAGEEALLDYCDWAQCDGASETHIAILVGSRVAVVLMSLINGWTNYPPDKVWEAYMTLIAAKKEGLK